MKRCEAIREVMASLPRNALVVTSAGHISREVYLIGDSSRIFYMMGSLGLASSTGLGLALALPESAIVVMEGDGSILLNLGSLATVAHYSPRNLTHLVLDNAAYDSTGGQPSSTTTVPLNRIAKGAGYALVLRASSREALKGSLDKVWRKPSSGPFFILVKVERGSMLERLPRVSRSPGDITSSFMGSIDTLNAS